MISNIEKYKKEVQDLYMKGISLELGFLEELGLLDREANKKTLEKAKPLSFKTYYENWYSEAIALIRQLLPDRLVDFKALYKNDKRKETDFLTYTISDYLIGLTVRRGGEIKVDGNAAFPKFQQQVKILESTRARFVSSLFEISQLVQADLFDSELETSKELNTKGFNRAAGAITGVILEKHLKKVLQNRNIVINKKYPGIADLSVLLKDNGVIDIPQWRSIQLMADIRNLCDHNKEREPRKDEIEDLISGVNKVMKSIH